MPESAADGEFYLTSSEALAVGVLMVDVSQRQWAEERLNDPRLRELKNRLLRARGLEELFDVMGRIAAEHESADDGDDAK